MSYAEMAAKGPKQSPEETGVSHTFHLLEVVSLRRRLLRIVRSMPWYPTVFKTRAMSFKALSCKVVLTCTHSRAPAQPQVEHASDDSVHSLVDVDSPHISSVPSDYESQEIKTDTQAERIEREEEIKEEVKNVKERAAAKKDAAKEKVKKNADNPVVLSNAVGLAVVGGIVGFGAYRQYVRGELTGKVVAAWAAVIGLFGVGDYYVSQYFFKRNPPK